jgi:NAD(P)H-hydrate epimerase
VHEAKKEFRNGIVVPRSNIEEYIKEADSILIGPGLARSENTEIKNSHQMIHSLDELEAMQDEGEQTYYLTEYLLSNYPDKKYVLDAGSLQMMKPEWLLSLSETPILTPHKGEFERLFGIKLDEVNEENVEVVSQKAKELKSVIIVKGLVDIVCSANEIVLVRGGNSGMTKGGTGDVLAGLVASLYSKNPAFLSAVSASYINKKAGESLFEKVGYYFNASDLADEIPKVMNELITR